MGASRNGLRTPRYLRKEHFRPQLRCRQSAASMRAFFAVCRAGCVRCDLILGVLEGPESQNKNNSPALEHQVHWEYFPHERPVESDAWWALTRLIVR